MDKLFVSFSEDLNRENSSIIAMFGNFTDCLFAMVKWFGIPFVTVVAFLHFFH